MAPEKAPAFQFYPKDYLSDPRVKAMSFEQRGLYWDAVSICWLEGTLPADPSELAAILGCPAKRFNGLWPRIASCFQEHGGRLTHKRLDKERKAQSESRDRRAAAARTRWDKDHTVNALHMQSTTDEQPPVDAKQCSPSSSASSSSTSSTSSTAVRTDTRPLVSGEANPRTWGKIHGEHFPGFCDWVCLPEFVYLEFVRKSPGPEYVTAWAAGVRRAWQGKNVGDNLKFWRARWSESHPEVVSNKPRPIEEILAERERKSS